VEAELRVETDELRELARSVLKVTNASPIGGGCEAVATVLAEVFVGDFESLSAGFDGQGRLTDDFVRRILWLW
jgi:hypothetical protein